MIAIRKRHHVLRRRTFFASRPTPAPEVVWHGRTPGEPDFSAASHAVAFALDGRGGDRPEVDRDLYVALNAHWEPAEFEVPPAPGGRAWRRAVDTALPSPDDAVGLDEGPIVAAGRPYRVEARSMVILVSEG